MSSSLGRTADGTVAIIYYQRQLLYMLIKTLKTWGFSRGQGSSYNIEGYLARFHTSISMISSFLFFFLYPIFRDGGIRNRDFSSPQ